MIDNGGGGEGGGGGGGDADAHRMRLEEDVQPAEKVPLRSPLPSIAAPLSRSGS